MKVKKLILSCCCKCIEIDGGEILFTFGSAFLIALLLIGLFRHRNYNGYFMYLIKVLVVFSVNIQIGYFANLGGFQVEYAEVLMVLVILLGLPFIKNTKIPKRSLLFAGALLFSIFIGYMHLIFTFNPPNVLPIGYSWDRIYRGIDRLTPQHFLFLIS